MRKGCRRERTGRDEKGFDLLHLSVPKTGPDHIKALNRNQAKMGWDTPPKETKSQPNKTSQQGGHLQEMGAPLVTSGGT